MSSVHFLVGKTLGKYEVLEHIGHGGMAEVYKGQHVRLDRPVAIKILHPFLADEEGFVVRFQREARIVATLRHPNIMQVFDFDYHEELNIYYMVMEYIEGSTLKSMMMEQEKVPVEDAVRVGAAIAEALDYAHRRDMVHRDIKPANIMFTSEGEPVLTDFGIAKMMSLSGLTASGAMIGTPAYMAPEVGLGKKGASAADIYSLGVVMYQMVTGQLPFESDNPMNMVMQHINDAPPLPAQLNPELPSTLEVVILRTLNKKPEERFVNAGAMASALRHALGMDTPTREFVLEATPLPKGSKEQEQEQEQEQAPDQDRAQEQTPTSDASQAKVDNLLVKDWSDEPAPETPALGVNEIPGPGEMLEKKRKAPFIWRLTRSVLLLLLLSIVAAGAWIGFGGAVPEEVRRRIPVSLLEELPLPAGAIESLAISPSPTGTPRVTEAAAGEGVTATATLSPSSTATPAPEREVTPTSTLDCSVRAKIASVSLNPDEIVPPETEMTAYFTIRNMGYCAWPSGMRLNFTSGDQMGAPDSVQLEKLAPDQQVQILLTFQAPAELGVYEGTWAVIRPDGELLDKTGAIELEVSDVTLATETPSPVTETPPPESLSLTEPELVTWEEDVAAGRWYGTIRLQAEGGTGSYRYYRTEVREATLLPDDELQFEWRRCEDFPLTIWVLSGEEAFQWEGSIPYPAPEQCE